MVVVCGSQRSSGSAPGEGNRDEPHRRAPCPSMHLFLRGRAELLGLLGGDGGRHVEGQHQLVVAELLVELQLGDEVIGEGDDGLDPLLQLAVTEVVQQVANLQGARDAHRGHV